MENRTTTTVLRDTFGAALDAETVATLRTMGKRCVYRPGTVLCHQGAVEDTFYIIVEGSVIVTQKPEGGQERVLSMLGANQYFGELGLLDDAPRSMTCMVAKPTTVIEVTKEVFAQIVETSPTVAFAITQRVLAELRRTSEQSIHDLREKNQALETAYRDLQKAQESLLEKERLERELDLAAEMQGSLLPKTLPTFPDYVFSAHQQAARRVGGDLFNVIPLDDEHVGFTIADVSDKGFQAALFMAMTQTLFFREGRRSLSPAAVTTSVHAGLIDVAPTSDVFVTAFYGVLHRPSGRVTYVRAGHEHPLLARPGQPVVLLPGEGRFLGMIEELELQEYEVVLRPGDRLVLYSDGVTDAIDSQGKLFGRERLLAVVHAARALPAQQIVQQILGAVGGWCRGTPPFDDLTLLVVEAR
jgi:phosphoserine phosphatase RsbU/P